MTGNSSLPNYRSIAKECGVGKTTVGRVLQNTGYVSDKVRQRVLEAAKRLGYRPDPALGVLARRRWPGGAQLKTATIAYIHHGIATADEKTAPEYHGVRQRAAELGYSTDAFSLRDYPSVSAINRVIFSRGIQGVLVQAFRDDIHIDLDWARFFTIFIGPENDLARVHNVQADFRSSLHQGVQVCKDRGYRRIGIALMNHSASGTNIPFNAQALYERFRLEGETGPQPQIIGYEPQDRFAPQFFQWFRREKPDVVVSTNIQPYYWLTSARYYDRGERNWKIPQDTAFVCLRSGADNPDVAHMDLREKEQGRQAVDLVHQQLQHGALGIPEIPLRLLIPPFFVDGSSLPEKKSRKR